MLSKTFILIVLVLLLASLFAPANNPAQEHKIFLHDLKKIGASKSELDTLGILLNTNASQGEIEKRSSSIIQRRLSKFSPSQQKVYYDLGDEERLDYLASSDPDRWVKSRDRKLTQKLCTTRGGKVQYYSLRDLLDPKELQDFIRQDSSGRMEWLKRYWSFKDPTPTTARNEWKEEFDSRVDFALANFHSVFGERPWDDRGDVYIKLGEPFERELSADSSWKVKMERRKGLVILDTEEETYRTAGELWTYYAEGKELHFQFEDMKFTGYYQLVPYKSASKIDDLDYVMDSRVEYTKLAVNKAIYRHDYGGGPLDFSWEAIKFRSLNNVYEVLVNVGVPTGKLERDSSGLVNYNQQIAIRDEKGNFVDCDSVKVSQKVPDFKNQLLIDQKAFLLSPGTYSVAVEIKDIKSKKIGLYKDELFLPGYVSQDSLQSKELELSRAILSPAVREAQPGDTASKFFLNGYVIVPNPSHVFLFEQEPEIRAYFEIYNLKPKDDTLRFATISQVIKYVSADSAIISSDTTVTIHQGFVPGAIAYQIIHLVINSGSYFEPGDYLWRIDVIDLNAPHRVESIVDKLRITKSQTKEGTSGK
jgi:GWxTD domain-containing protein